MTRQLIPSAYAYDAVSNIATLRDWSLSPNTSVYTYDGFNRLTGVSGEFSATYGYDAVGNLTSKTENGATVTLAYNNSAHVHAPSTANGAALLYDATGNMTTTVRSGVTYRQVWDGANRLSQQTAPSSVTFTYDAAGQRASMTAGGVTTHYVGGR